MESTDGETHLALPVLSISRACPIAWTADSLCGVKAGYMKMMCDLPRCVQLSRERIHLLSLIFLTDLSVGQMSVHSMFDLFSVIQRFLWWPSSLISFVCDFLTAEPWQ